MAYQNRYVGGALAQRRRKDGKNLEPVKKIVAELFLSDHFSQVAIRRGDQPHVHVDGPRAAQPLDLALLQGAQKFRLQVERQLAHFVEEERAFVRQLQAAHLAHDGAGECAFLMAKELAFEQAGGDGGAIQLDKGALAARAQPVDGARQQLLAGSRLALDQHGGIGRGHRLNLAQHVAQARALAHDVVEAVLDIDLFFEIFLFVGQAVAQLGNLLKGQRIVHRHGHLPGYLDQHLGIVLRICALHAAGHHHGAKGPFAMNERHPDSRLQAHPCEMMHGLERKRPPVNSV